MYTKKLLKALCSWKDIVCPIRTLGGRGGGKGGGGGGGGGIPELSLKGVPTKPEAYDIRCSFCVNMETHL